MSVLRIALAVLRNDSRSRISTALVTVGVALGVSLVLWLASAPHALQERADRTAWHNGDNTVSQTDNRAQVVMATNLDQFDGKLIHRYDVTRAHVGGYVSLPPGIREFPEPGQVLLSPALAALVKATPPEKLGDRFPGQLVDEIGPQALEYPDELVAVIGHDVGTVDGWALTGLGGKVGYAADNADMLYLLTRIGMVVLIVPCLVLVASAARLTAARRERRLAALRLAGATPRQVLLAVAGESALVVAVGAALGGAAAILALWGGVAGLRDQTGAAVPLIVPWSTGATAVGVCLVLALAASVLPARGRLNRFDLTREVS